MTDPTQQPALTLAQLASAWYAAKGEETRAADLRKEIAAQIQLITGHQAESSKTYKDGDWKVVVKQPVNHTMDWDAWEAVKADIPEEFWPVETKTVLDEKGVKWIKDNDPAIYATLAQALTTRPGAVSVTVTYTEPKE